MEKAKYKYKLSILILCYNHEKYFKEAYESILKQKVNFSYEIIVGDDCSTDNSQKIIRKLLSNKKDTTLILRKKNIGATRNLFDMFSKSQGEYLTILESDDYWINENKLQRQIDFLDNNKDYICVSNKVCGINIDKKQSKSYPLWVKNDTQTTMRDFLNNKYFSSSGSMYRNNFSTLMDNEKFKNLFFTDRIVGDLVLCNFLLDNGKVFILNDAMQAYRIRNIKGESNYNSLRSGLQKSIDHIKILNSLDKYYNNKYDFKKIYNVWLSQAKFYSIINKESRKYKEIVTTIPKKYLNYFHFNCWKVYLSTIISKIKR